MRFWAAGILVLLVMAVGGRGEGPATMGAADEKFEVGTLGVERFGSGEKAVVLVPGLSCGGWVWAGMVEKLRGAYSVYVITLPGFDGRKAAEEKSLFAAFDRDFWKLLEEKKIENPVVIGHSLGGTLAIALGESHGERLSGIVAVDGLPVFPMQARATDAGRKRMGEFMEKMNAEMSAEEFLEGNRQFMGSAGTDKAELVEWAAKLEARSDPKAVGQWLREDMEADLRPGLTKIGVPLVEVMPYEPGDETGASGMTQEQAKKFYESLLAGAPRMSVAVVTPSRHFAMLDQPEKLEAVVEDFLAKAWGKGN